MSQDAFRLITEHPVTEYRCGVRAGERVYLKADLVVSDHHGWPVRVHPQGEVWTVQRGAAEESVVVWLRQADGETHTWSDDANFWRAFAILPRPSV